MNLKRKQLSKIKNFDSLYNIKLGSSKAITLG
uniref:Uncharacterized protein n=1 Tax=Rhizophora mucronata TaxID=61149 RepID=A0A2P2Q1I0_RHIMU